MNKLHGKEAKGIVFNEAWEEELYYVTQNILNKNPKKVSKRLRNSAESLMIDFHKPRKTKVAIAVGRALRPQKTKQYLFGI